MALLFILRGVESHKFFHSQSLGKVHRERLYSHADGVGELPQWLLGIQTQSRSSQHLYKLQYRGFMVGEDLPPSGSEHCLSVQCPNLQEAAKNI